MPKEVRDDGYERQKFNKEFDKIVSERVIKPAEAGPKPAETSKDGPRKVEPIEVKHKLGVYSTGDLKKDDWRPHFIGKDGERIYTEKTPGVNASDVTGVSKHTSLGKDAGHVRSYEAGKANAYAAEESSKNRGEASLEKKGQKLEKPAVEVDGAHINKDTLAKLQADKVVPPGTLENAKPSTGRVVEVKRKKAEVEPPKQEAPKAEPPKEAPKPDAPKPTDKKPDGSA